MSKSVNLTNELPKNWKWVKLGEAVQILDNLRKPINSSERQKRIAGKKGKELFPYYGATGQVGWIDSFITNGEYILVGEDGAPFLDFYKEKAYKINGKTWVNNHAHILQELKNISTNDFILHYLNSINYRQYVNGTTRLKLTKGSLVEIPFPVPSVATQQAIVFKIEELFSELDKGIENLRLVQQQLKTYRQSVLKWAFEGRLTEEWRKQQKKLISGRELLRQIKLEKERIAKLNKKKIKPLPEIDEEELEELFQIPKEWVWARNEEFLFEVKDGTHDTPKYFDKGIPFVTQKNIREDGLNFNDIRFISEEDHNNFYLRSNVSKDDILISMIGHNRGMTAIVDTEKIFSIKNVGLFKFFPQFQLNKFSFYYYQSRVGLNIVLRKSKGGAQPFIGLTELRNWPVIVCSFEEQNKIVQEIESRLSVADKMEESITQSLQQADALRQSILKKAFEGNLILNYY